jgi:hypothetical protein
MVLYLAVYVFNAADVGAVNVHGNRLMLLAREVPVDETARAAFGCHMCCICLIEIATMDRWGIMGRKVIPSGGHACDPKYVGHPYHDKNGDTKNRKQYPRDATL